MSGLSVFKHWKPDTDVLALRNEEILRENIGYEETDEDEFLKRLSPRKVILATISFITEIFREIMKELEESDYYNSTELVATAYKIITFTAELVRVTASAWHFFVTYYGNQSYYFNSVKDWNNKNNETTDEEDQYMTFPEFQAILDEEGKNEMVSNKVSNLHYNLNKVLNWTYTYTHTQIYMLLLLSSHI